MRAFTGVKDAKTGGEEKKYATSKHSETYPIIISLAPCISPFYFRCEAHLRWCCLLSDVSKKGTDEPLLNARMVAVIRKLVPHIRHGCISDPSPDSCAMGVVIGRSRDGLDRTRSFRGTNNVENFHKIFKDALSSLRTSPSLAHSAMLPFNAQWNLRMAGETFGVFGNVNIG